MEWIKLSVVYFIVCAFKCSAKSHNEVEDFSDFLKKTSQLDIILKKGTDPDNDSDDDVPVSDHAWEESGKFEGDLILNERQRRLIVENVAEGLSRNGLKDGTKRWPNNQVVYYIQREHFSGDQVQAIQDGIEDLARASCVKFRPYKKGDRDAVVIQGSRRGCFSQVGYQSGYQVLNLSGRHPVGRGCFRHGTVVHELLHTLGFYHMQSSPDRDDYINVLWENIIEPARHNFRKYNSFAVSDFGVGYDYDSVLHYSRRAFSANGRDTLVPKQGGASIGQRVGLSDKDTQKLNKMYCDADSNNYEADEETTQKPARKKNPKSKPFEGHGIGYHQGKTVVIKLPAAETYKLSDVPSFHMFDYFSKAPQTVLPSLIQGVGVGKEIESYSYKPPAFNTEEFTGALPDNTHNKPTIPSLNENEDVMIKTEISEGTLSNTEESTESSIKEADLSSGTEDINEAFERLGKIIKTHVYPSQTPNLSIYKMPDYSEFYKPKFETDQNIKEDEGLSSSLPPIDTGAKDYDTGVSNEKLSQQFIHMLYDSGIPSSEKQIGRRIPEMYEKEENPNDFALLTQYKDEQSSIGTDSFRPLNKISLENDKKVIKPTPEYAIHHKRLQQHYPQIKESIDSSLKGKHTLFGYVLPLKDNWYKKSEEYRRNQDEYDQDTFKYSDQNKNNYLHTHSPFTLRSQDDSESEKGIPLGPVARSKQAYSIVGVLVPLTHNLYNTDYDPYKASYTLKETESHEDKSR